MRQYRGNHGAQTEIDQSARRSSQDGRFPAGLEAELDDLFARLAPAARPGQFSVPSGWRRTRSALRRVIDDRFRRPAFTQPSGPVKVAFVVPRYGVEVFGGAEYAARMLAERLVSSFAWPVEVFTTCARDSVTWANAYPEEEIVINGVVVHRFRSEAGRDPGFDAFANRIGRAPADASLEDAERFIELQGPVCPAAVKAALDSDAELLIFYPYLYYPTVLGVPAAAARSVLHPAAHDEPWLRLPVFRSVFQRANALVFQTEDERQLVEGLFPVAHQHHLVLGLGVEAHTVGPATARDALGLGDAPYLLTVGRLDDGKGTTMLARFFAAYKERRPGPLKLVMAGQVAQAPPAHDDIIVPGPIDDDVKWSAFAGAAALVQPSYFEAFSLVLMEAWASGLPAIVNGRCGPLREHCRGSGAGVWFGGYATFEAAIDRLTRDPDLRQSMGRSGSLFVEQNYSWPVVITRYAHFLEDAVRPRRRARPRSA